MATFVVRRLLQGVTVVVATGVFVYGGWRVLRPDQYEGEATLAGTARDLERALLHLDLGEACVYAGCPDVRELFLAGLMADIWLLAGGLAIGVLGGYRTGAWCAAHRRTIRARGIEAVAMLLYCIPPYVLGFGLLLLFAPPFGLVQIPVVFEVHRYAPLHEDPAGWFTSLLIPWLVVAAPVWGASLRISTAMTVDAADEDYVRTAIAKGLPEEEAVRRHARPAARVAVLSYLGAAVPAIVFNLVLVEAVFSVPGFFRHMRRALGTVPGFPPGLDVPTLQALALWAAVLIVIVGIAADLAIVRADPRLRSFWRQR